MDCKERRRICSALKRVNVRKELHQSKRGFNVIITRETDYAVRILRSLINLRLKNIREISDEQLIPRQFAYKISKKMERAGYIEIIRGAQGGCRLVKNLHDITLMDLIQVMDRENMLSNCLDEGFVCPYRERNGGDCGLHTSFGQLQEQLTAYFSGVNLYDLVSGTCQNQKLK